MTRGDTETLTVAIYNESDVLVPLVTGDTVTFTMKPKCADLKDTLAQTATLSKVVTSFSAGLAEINFASADTASIEVGEGGYNEYVYEIEVLFDDGERKTVMNGTLKLWGDLNG
jgi:hypothetical protein